MTSNKIASRCRAPQAFYDRRRHWNCFQTGPAQALPKSKYLLRSKVSWCDQISIDLHLPRSVLVSRSINMLSVTDFVSVHAGTSQVDFEVDRTPPAACPPGNLLITMVKETVILYKKQFRKKKKLVSLKNLKVMKKRNDCKIASDWVKCANVVLHVGQCQEIFSWKHTATH